MITKHPSQTVLHVVDASPMALQTWTKRCAHFSAVQVELHHTLSPDVHTLPEGLWVLVPESFDSPTMHHQLMTLARVPQKHAQVMVLRTASNARSDMDVSPDTMLIEAGESEIAIVRSLRSLIKMHQMQTALHAALQFPAENPNPVLCLEAAGELVYANPAAKSLLANQEKGEASLLLSLQRQLGHLGEEIPESTQCEVEVNGATYAFRFEVDGHAGRINVYGTDITANLEAQRARTTMERESKNKDVFLTAMSHELRTPLNAILSCTEAMREGAYGNLDAEQLDAVTTIRESGKHLLCLITDILDISKMQAGKLELSPATLGIQAVCDSVMEMVKSQAEKKSIVLTMANHASVDTFQGDPLRMKQILLNLLGNGIKFTPEGGQVGLEVSNTPGDAKLDFRVWDTGPGIDANQARTIFKPFVQAGGQHNRAQSGTGLGLSIARHLARLHEGELTLETFDSPGAVFQLTIPIGEDLEEPEFDFRATGSWDLPGNAPEVKPASRRVERVLIAEDTDTNYQHLHDMLVSLGYTVDRAVNGQEAIDLCANLQPDLVLMDIDMPYVNGLDAIRVIRQSPENATLPIIAVTAMSGIAEEQACLSAGADGFLAKPYPLRDLMTLMQRVANNNVRT